VGWVECTIDGTVVCALEDSRVCAVNDGTVVCTLEGGRVGMVNDGTVVCALDDGHCLLVLLLLEVDSVDMLGTVELSAVA
jgi:hypothetical protein